MMKLNIIESEADYKSALARIEEIFDAVPNTQAGIELDLLVTLVESYESKMYPIDLPERDAGTETVKK